ncbi:MAG: helix-turn-helix transcriptional regulator [bacterium]|nr:helix-turn-helix transcriptional regulator [bacterium]
MDKSTVLLRRFGIRVRLLRQSRGFSQEALADLCQLDRTYISSLERGQRNVGLKNLHALAVALEISLATLLETVDDRDEP